MNSQIDLTFVAAQGEALRLMLVAHIASVERLLPGSAEATAQNADLKRRAALKLGQVDVASALEAMLDHLRERLALPSND